MKFLEGKKTYIGAGLLALAACAGFLLGSFNVATTTLILGAAMTSVGLGSKIQRFAPAIISGLQELKSVQAQIAAGQKVNVTAEVTKVAGIALSAEMGDRG